MKNAEINIGKLCNNSCVFCANGLVPRDEKRWVDAKKVISELSRASVEGIKSAGFLGGEISIYPHALEVISEAKRLGFERISICTNGRKFKDPSLVERFIEAGATRFTLSIHSHQEGVEDVLNSRKGAFREKIEAIKSFVKASEEGRLRHGFSINSCIHGKNYLMLLEMARFFKGLGVAELRFNMIRPVFMVEMDRGIIPRISDCIPHMMNLILTNERDLEMSITFGDVPICAWPSIFFSNTLARRYLGELKDLETTVTVFGSRNGIKLPDRFSWNERRSGELKIKSESCGRCAVRGRCEGVWRGYADIYGLDEIAPISSQDTEPSYKPEIHGSRSPELKGANAARRIEKEGTRSITIWRDLPGDKTTLEATLRLTKRCNQRCVFCGASESDKVTKTEAKRFIRELSRSSFETRINISGGEPTLDGALDELVATALENPKTTVIVQTNALRFSGREYASRYPTSERLEFFVSFHGFDESTYERLTGVPGCFLKAVEGINNLLSLGHSVMLNFVATSINTPGLASGIKKMPGLFTIRKDLPPVNVSVMSDFPGMEMKSGLFVRYDILWKEIVRAEKAAKKAGVGFAGFGGTGNCHIPACILPSSRRMEVTRLRVIDPDLLDRGLRRYATGQSEGMVKSATCISCHYNSFCSGVPKGYAKSFGLDALKPVIISPKKTPSPKR